MGALYSRYLGWLLASGNKSILLGQVLVVNLSDHFVWILFVTTISALRELELTRTPKESIVVRQVKNAANVLVPECRFAYIIVGI